MSIILKKLIKKGSGYLGLRSPDDEESYSQAGEDRIISFLFRLGGIENPKYLDVGANHPIYLSNTYYFYKRGCSGVCVEPNPTVFEEFRKKRPRDIALNLGVTTGDETMLPLYCFGPEADGLTTFSKANAEQSEQELGYKIQRVREVPVRSINEIIEEHFETPPDLLSIDVEGLDLEILTSLDFNKHPPRVICAETHSQEEGLFLKKSETSDYLTANGYSLYADTFINSIFIRTQDPAFSQRIALGR
jgi:FkbM family methyltransferase